MLEKNNTTKLGALIYREPLREFTIRELARNAKIAPPTALLIVRALQKKGIVKERIVGRASQISANFESEQYRQKKRLSNLEQLYDSQLIELLVTEYHDPKAIILFGSYSRGEDTERSDIDIAVITTEKKTRNLARFEKLLSRSISIHEIQLKNISEELKNNLYNGIILRGAL